MDAEELYNKEVGKKAYEEIEGCSVEKIKYRPTYEYVCWLEGKVESILDGPKILTEEKTYYDQKLIAVESKKM